VADRSANNDLKPTDKAIPGVVSESPGRNERERISSLEIQKLRRPRPYREAEGSTGRRILVDATARSGGVEAAAR